MFNGNLKCPVCKFATGIYYWPPTQISDELVGLVRAGMLDPAALATVPLEMPLYQKSYKGEPEYISPRCSRCYDKALKVMEKRKIRREHVSNKSNIRRLI